MNGLGSHLPPQRRPPRYGLWLGVLLAVLAMAAAAYVLLPQLGMGGLAQGTDKTSAEQQAQRPGPAAKPAAPEASRRSATILSCTAPDGSVFYTNALSCAEADLDNRVNVIPARKPAEQVTQRVCLGAQGEDRVHSFLGVCNQPFNDALRLEPLLLKAPDPRQSIRAREYCDLITQGVQAGCMATSQQFCFLDLCQQLREANGS